MAAKVQPLGARVLVEPKKEAERKTTGGIIIPDTAGEKPTEGKVIEVGPGRRLEDGTIMPLNVNKGDRVLYGKWSGTEIKVDGKEYLIVNEDDIYGVIE